MTKEHLEKTLRLYLDRWAIHYVSKRLDTEDFFPAADKAQAMGHNIWMCEQAIAFIHEGQLEKAFRWLGFIQGVFWCCGHYTIDEMRAHSTEPTDP